METDSNMAIWIAGGIFAVLLIFVAAWRIVVAARRGNRKVRRRQNEQAHGRL